MGSPVVANIVVGPAIIYVAPYGEAVPAEGSIDLGEAWGGNWERVGFTKTGVTALYEFERGEVEVEELLTTPKRWKTAEAMSAEVTLAELTADYLLLGVGAGTVTTEAAGAGQPANEVLNVGGLAVLDEYAVGIEGTFTNSSGVSFPIRYFLHKCNIMINGGQEFAKAGQPGIPLRIDALSDPTKPKGSQLYQYQRVTAAATS
jgi:hypothetical protein